VIDHVRSFGNGETGFGWMDGWKNDGLGGVEECWRRRRIDRVVGM
jgi:hypothetical protein